MAREEPSIPVKERERMLRLIVPISLFQEAVNLSIRNRFSFIFRLKVDPLLGFLFLFLMRVNEREEDGKQRLSPSFKRDDISERRQRTLFPDNRHGPWTSSS